MRSLFVICLLVTVKKEQAGPSTTQSRQVYCFLSDPNSYLHAAAPGFVAAAPVAMAPMAVAPVAMAPMAPGGYAPNPAAGIAPNMNGHMAPAAGHKPGYETETISAAGAFGGLVFVSLLICCCCFVKKYEKLSARNTPIIGLFQKKKKKKKATC